MRLTSYQKLGVIGAVIGALAAFTIVRSAHAQVAPLPGADAPPPSGMAYVLSSPNDPTWLTLATREGRWVIQLDPQTCGPAVVPPASEVQVTLQVDTLGEAAIVWPLTLTPQGQAVPDPFHPCEVQAALFASRAPCAELDGQCDIAAEAAYEPQ